MELLLKTKKFVYTNSFSSVFTNNHHFFHRLFLMFFKEKALIKREKPELSTFPHSLRRLIRVVIYRYIREEFFYLNSRKERNETYIQ